MQGSFNIHYLQWLLNGKLKKKKSMNILRSTRIENALANNVDPDQTALGNLIRVCTVCQIHSNFDKHKI